jgi:hypothetical protein
VAVCCSLASFSSLINSETERRLCCLVWCLGATAIDRAPQSVICGRTVPAPMRFAGWPVSHCVTLPHWPPGAAHVTGCARCLPCVYPKGYPFEGRAAETETLSACSCLVCRFSSAVEQRFCKPKVGSSILSTGTNRINKLRPDRFRQTVAKRLTGISAPNPPTLSTMKDGTI